MAGEFYSIGLVDPPKTVDYPDKAKTVGVGPCMAVGILNRSTRRGYLGHYVWLSRHSEALVDKAIIEARDIRDLAIALAGNSLPNREEASHYGWNFEEVLEASTAHGEWALQMVKSKGIKLITNCLNNNTSMDSYEMEVDTEKRRILVRKEEYDP